MTQDQATEKFIEVCQRIAKLQKKYGVDSEKLVPVKQAYNLFNKEATEWHLRCLEDALQKVEDNS